MWDWIAQHWPVLVIIYGLELIRRELVEIRMRLQAAHPTEGEKRFKYDVDTAYGDHREPR